MYVPNVENQMRIQQAKKLIQKALDLVAKGDFKSAIHEINGATVILKSSEQTYVLPETPIQDRQERARNSGCAFANPRPISREKP